MDATLWHLRVNHFPIVLALAGAVAMLAALLFKRPWMLRYAQATLIAAAVFAPMAYLSGGKAEDEIEKVWYAPSHDAIEEHEEGATLATIVMVVTGLLAVASVVRDKAALRLLLLVASLASAGLVVSAGFHGGKLVHENAAVQKGAP